MTGCTVIGQLPFWDSNLVTEECSLHPSADRAGEPALCTCSGSAGVPQAGSADPAAGHCQAGGKVSYTSLRFSPAVKGCTKELR